MLNFKVLQFKFIENVFLSGDNSPKDLVCYVAISHLR